MNSRQASALCLVIGLVLMVGAVGTAAANAPKSTKSSSRSSASGDSSGGGARSSSTSTTRSSSSESKSSSKSTSTTTTTRPTTTTTRATTTTTTKWLTDEIPSSYNDELTAIDAVYGAIAIKNWDYARNHFTNGYGEGPKQPDGWWEGQYGTLREHRLAPARVSGGTLYVGLITHETDAAGGPYSYVFCIPFSVSGSNVRQTGPAKKADRINGEWVDWKAYAASASSC